MPRPKTAADRVANRFVRMRDMFEGAPSAEEEITLRVMAAFHPEYELLEPQAPEYTAKMPGDDEHPLAKTGSNPFPHMSQQQLIQAMREDKIPQELRYRVGAYLKRFQQMDGQDQYGFSISRVSGPAPMHSRPRFTGAEIMGIPYDPPSPDED